MNRDSEILLSDGILESFYVWHLWFIMLKWKIEGDFFADFGR